MTQKQCSRRRNHRPRIEKRLSDQRNQCESLLPMITVKSLPTLPVASMSASGKLTCLQNSPSKPPSAKTVQFSDSLITREIQSPLTCEQMDESLKDLLWYKKSDFKYFKRTFYDETADFMRRFGYTNVKIAMNVMLRAPELHLKKSVMYFSDDDETPSFNDSSVAIAQ